jgi:hypothetical protein
VVALVRTIDPNTGAKSKISRREARRLRKGHKAASLDGDLTQRRKWMRKTVIIPTLALLLAGGAAFAIFTSEGAGTGPASNPTTGTAAPTALTVTSTGKTVEASGSLTSLQPTVGAPVATNEQVVSAQVVAPNAALVSHVVATVATDGSGNVLNTLNADAPVPGCLAAWYVVNTQVAFAAGESTSGWTTAAFNATDSGTELPATLVASGPNIAASTIYLSDPTGSTNQNACEGISPLVNIAVS